MPKRRKQYTDTGLANFFGSAIRAVIIVIVVAAIGAAGYIGASIYFQMKDLPDITAVERYEPIEAVQIFDRFDNLICTVEGDEDRRVVPLNQVSSQMQQAMLAAEDHHFFEHHGINVVSIVRACFVNLQAGHVVEGGSTITQQLAKNLFFSDSGRTINRKLKEVYVAWELERRYTKEHILEMYLNQVYFGNNAYGIERAAARYFDTSAAQLNLAQSAFLAGLVKAPSELGTSANRAEAITRQKEILDKMVEYGYVTPRQEQTALNTKLVFRKGANPLQRYPYYVSYVIELLRARFTPSELRREGFRVYTNLDPKAQNLAEETLSAAIKRAPKGITQGALVSLSVADGSVLAMVGGVGNFWQNQFNRATNPHTVGSAFKPFVYLTGFLKGSITPESSVEDTPLVVHQGWGLPDYIPKDFDKKFYGKITIRKALALSRNIPAIRTAQLVGIDNVVETARNAGITAKLDPNLSLALGSSAVSPIDMASAYSTFARGGIALAPTVIRKIENNRGQVIAVYNPKSDQVFPTEPVAQLIDVLQDVVKYGTGAAAKLPDRPVAGKTGTADAGKDIWFVGFTPDLVTALWAGNDQDLPIPGSNVTGGGVMAKIWHDYNTGYYKIYPTAPGVFIARSNIKAPPTSTSTDQTASNDNAASANPDDGKTTNGAPGPLQAEMPTSDNRLNPNNNDTPTSSTGVSDFSTNTQEAPPRLVPSYPAREARPLTSPAHATSAAGGAAASGSQLQLDNPAPANTLSSDYPPLAPSHSTLQDHSAGAPTRLVPAHAPPARRLYPTNSPYPIRATPEQTPASSSPEVN